METFLKETDMSLLGCVVVVGFALFKLELEDRPGKKKRPNMYFLFCFCLICENEFFCTN